MKIVLSNEALNWFQEEMDVIPGDSICFYARYGGASPLHVGFSLGITKDDPIDASVKIEHDSVLYYIESQDQWFFLEHDLHVKVDPKSKELIFSYEKA